MADRTHRVKFDITAENRAKAAFAALKSDMEGVQAAAGKLTGVLAGLGLAAAVGGGLVATLADIIKYRSALDDLADTTGDNVTTLDGLARAARVSGVEIGDLGNLLTKLAKNLGDSGDDGKAAAEALKAVGLSVDALRALRPSEAFLEVAKALDQYADGADKVRVAQALLGKEGAKSLPLLKDLAEIGELQGRVTAEQAAAAEKLEKETKKLAIAYEDGKSALASALIPEITRLISEMRTGIEIAGSFGEAIRLFGLGINPARSLGENIQAEMKRLEDVRQQRSEVYAFMRKDAIDAAEADALKRLKFLRQQEQDAALRLATAATLDARDLKARQKPAIDFKGTPEKKGNEFKELVQSLQSELARIDSNFSKEEELRLLLVTEKYRKLTDAERDRIVELGRLIDTRKQDQLVSELNAKDEKKSIEDQIALLRKKGEELRSASNEFAVLADPTLPILERLRRLGEVQKSEVPGVALDPEQADIAYFKLQQELLHVQQGVAAVNDEMRQGDDIARDLGLTFTSAFEDAIAGGKSLSEVLRGLAADVGKIITRKTITEPLGNAVSGLLKDFNVGGVFKDMFRADGGPVSAGGAYIVGERGPELFVPRSSGTIAPNGSFGGQTIVINGLDMRGASVEAVARLERFVAQLSGSIEARAVGGLRSAAMRGAV